MEMATDVQLLILSEGKSNILPADLVLPFQPSSVDSAEPVAAEALEAWRWYLATLRSLPNSIEPELQKVCVSVSSFLALETCVIIFFYLNPSTDGSSELLDSKTNIF